MPAAPPATQSVVRHRETLRSCVPANILYFLLTLFSLRFGKYTCFIAYLKQKGPEASLKSSEDC